MTSTPQSLWIGGQEVEGHGYALPVENPATGETITKINTASASDVEQAVDLAHAAFKSGIWSRASRHHRAATLDRIGTLLTNALPTLIAFEVQQTGRAIREMRAQVPSLVRWFTYYASLLRTEQRPVLPTTGKLHNWVERRARGVVVLICPFNHPLLIAVKKLAPALAAGNSVLLKPSELTPVTSLLLGEILREAGIPDGVFSVVHGTGAEVGKALVSHPLVRKVDVTGGTPAGRAIGEIAGRNLAHFTAELGGKAPVVVFEDAELGVVVNGIAFGSWIASGQTCIAATRIIVHRSILWEVLDQLKEKAESILRRMGSPSDERTSMGPLISEKQLSNVVALVDDAVQAGVTLVTGGKRLTSPPKDAVQPDFDFSKGYFYPPTILTDGQSRITDVRIWREEAFGPVIVVVGFDNESEAIRLANDSEFGLGAAIWTRDLSRAFRVSEEIEAGICWVNTHHRNDPSSPWGGVGSSGVGSENGIEAYHEYTTMKSTIINYASTEENLANDDWFKEDSGAVRYG